MTGTTAVCQACGSIMKSCNAPQTIFSISIPFTRFTIEIMDYNHEEYVCLECYSEKKQESYREAFEQGQESGYYEGYYRNRQRLL